mgnify:CR=1 FL=1
MVKEKDFNSCKYKIIINGGPPIYASLEEAQKLIEEYSKRNHLNYLIDETWRIYDTIYLNDLNITSS